MVPGEMSGGSVKRQGLKACALFVVAPLLIAAAAAEEHFHTRLLPVARDLLTRDDVAGVGRATATLSGDRLSVSGRFAALPSAATAAELREGVAVGARGPAMLPLSVSPDRQGAIAASARLNPAQRQALRSGRVYVLIRSERAPGNLWGWLLPATGLPKLK